MLSGTDPIAGDARRDARPDALLALGREGAFSLHPLRARAGRAAASTAG